MRRSFLLSNDLVHKIGNSLEIALLNDARVVVAPRQGLPDFDGSFGQVVEPLHVDWSIEEASAPRQEKTNMYCRGQNLRHNLVLKAAQEERGHLDVGYQGVAGPDLVAEIGEVFGGRHDARN